MDSGLYIAVFHLARGRRIDVGRLGRFAFPAGMYFYVGSARKSLSARLARHARRRKAMRWHIDYLSARARMLGAIVLPSAERDECEVAAELSRLYARSVDRFGASDCRCGGHLFVEN